MLNKLTYVYFEKKNYKKKQLTVKIIYHLSRYKNVKNGNLNNVLHILLYIKS